jgi:hypothetical protein
MKFQLPRALRAPLLMLAAAAGLAALLTHLSGKQFDRATAAQQREQTRLDETRVQLARARGAQELAGRYQAPYLELVRQGFVGANARLAWLDALSAAQRESGIARLDYQLAAQTPVAEATTQAVRLTRSEMKVRLELLHEGELLRFLERLKLHAHGRYHVGECALARVARHAQPINQPTLAAECLILWFAVEPVPIQGGGA